MHDVSSFDLILLDFSLSQQVNISLVVHDCEAKQCVRALHSAFFENGFLSEVDETDLFQNGSATLPSAR